MTRKVKNNNKLHYYHSRLSFHKLRETNAFLMDVIGALPERTLLVVAGDHGMTSTGDHGGATDLETDTALFFLSTAPYDKERPFFRGTPVTLITARLGNPS